MGTAWFLARSTSAIQTDSLVLIMATCGIVVAILCMYLITRRRYATQWVVYGCIVLIIVLTSIVLITDAIRSIVLITEVRS